MTINVAVIGAGPTGMIALRHLAARGSTYNCVAFEMNGAVGGMWNYTDETGNNEFGLPVRTSLYKSLMTNLPPNVMSYADFPLITVEKFIPSEEVLRYHQNYAEHFNLEPYIKFYHHVTHVKAVDKKWAVTVRNLKTDKEDIHEFDAVMMCHGHNSLPNIPELSGIDSFRGETLSSHEYRTPGKFQGKKVLIVGGMFSARDIALDIFSVAEQVIISHHNKDPITDMNFRENTIQKPDVKAVTEKTVIFQDDSENEIDTIVYCAGYVNDFSFLDENCKFTVDDNFVQPLYKHMFHIHHPTLCVIGLLLWVSPLAVADLQVRFFLNALEGSIRLPSTDDMIADTDREMQWRKAEPGYTNRKAHKMGPHQEAYCKDIAEEAQEPPLPLFFFKR